MGAASTRHSLRPLHLGRVVVRKTRADSAARTQTLGSSLVAAHPSRRGLTAAPQYEVVMRVTKSDPHGEERGKAARLRTTLRIALRTTSP